ncbi:site-specific integrase [Erythrobacter sp. GH1-10]|uniref:site-specific integrase n=1 Tax=Erythrobacter sp. GH1-10 TaxID=3349334 RepID=UPI0038780F94
MAEEIVEENPANHIRPPAPEVERDRFHTVEELAEIWAAAKRLGYPFEHFTKLLIAVPMRRNEIASIQLSEIDFSDDLNPGDSVWTLPSDRTKNAFALRVPLSPLAREIIISARDHEARPTGSEFLFSTTGTTPISGFAKAKRKLDSLIQKRRDEKRGSSPTDNSSMAPWIWHDLRTTFATLASDELSIDPQVADRCLNHQASATRSKIARIYNRSELFEPRKAALAAWGKFIEERVSGSPLAAHSADHK